MCPDCTDITINAQLLWVYATVDGRDFKVAETDDGDLIVRERVAVDTWSLCVWDGADTLGEAILNHSH